MSDTKEITTSFLIADLEGYTSLTEAHGDLQAVELVTRYVKIVEESLTELAFLVERKGDEVLITSDNTESLIETAINLLNKSKLEAHFPSLHVGLHSGMVIKSGGKYFGHTLNLTSRICSYSKGGQILCSQEIVTNVVKSNKYKFQKIGDIKFKNVINPLPVFQIIVEANRINLAIDLVCKMQVKTGTTETKLEYKDTTFFFCSNECLEKFKDNPDDYF